MRITYNIYNHLLKNKNNLMISDEDFAKIINEVKQAPLYAYVGGVWKECTPSLLYIEKNDNGEPWDKPETYKYSVTVVGPTIYSIGVL